jgi:phosphatidylglycerol---prolipoprotein diacylglyceryl transferase
MFPILFRIGSLPINSYGVTLAISFLLGVHLATRRAARLGIRPADIADLGVWVMLAAIVGSRAFYVATHVEEFRGHWLDVIAFWKGLYGLSMLGGVLLAIATGFFVIARRKWPVWALADASIPSFALGIFITRIGCFLNGCCFGTATCSPPGVVFPQGSLPWEAYGFQPVHPTQLYGSVGGLLLLAMLLFTDRRPHFPGFIFALFLGLYGASRFGLEEFRHFDHATSTLLGYSSFAGRAGTTDNQLISLVMFAGAFVLGWILWRRSVQSAPPAGRK